MRQLVFNNPFTGPFKCAFLTQFIIATHFFSKLIINEINNEQGIFLSHD